MKKAFHPALVLILFGFALAQLGCTNDSLDDGSSPDVILEVQTLENTPVTAEEEDDGGGGGGCTLTVTDWSATLKNEPKNSLAIGPFNNIEMEEVAIEYSNFPAAIPARVEGLGGTLIEVGSSSPVTFTPIQLQDLTGALEASTGTLTLTFRGHTIEGTGITKRVSRALSIEACP
ncbi:MAG: hypothetical protein GY716_14045 [bacterium]|nr:hypothetical protein [bacterium]